MKNTYNAIPKNMQLYDTTSNTKKAQWFKSRLNHYGEKAKIVKIGNKYKIYSTAETSLGEEYKE
jgi:hypothetical protein